LNPAAISAEELADVMFKADQASAIVVDYLKLPFDDGPLVNPLIFPPAVGPFWTSASTPTLVKAAILLILTSLYDGRTADDPLLSEQVTAILHRMRHPSLA
jgi:hypothetical protein